MALMTVSRTPLYLQARQILLKRIEDGEWKAGTQIPVESDLASQLGISLGTLRRAVESLVSDGILLKRQGAGTFVRTYQNSGYWNAFQIFKDFDGKRRGSKWRMIVFERIKAPHDVLVALQIKPEDKVIHIVRAWEQDYFGVDEVVSIDESFLIESRFIGLTKQRFLTYFRSDDSLYRFYDREFGVVVINQKCSVRYEDLPSELSQRWQMPEHFRALRTDRVSMTFGHRPVEYRINRGRIDVTKVLFDLS